MFVYEKNNKICIDNTLTQIPKDIPDVAVGFDETGAAVIEMAGVVVVPTSSDDTDAATDE